MADDSFPPSTPLEPALPGEEIIRLALRDMPVGPGVYRMEDAKGNVLYIGKAKNLKARLSSYTHVDGMAMRTKRMVAQVARVEVTAARSEAEALLLEANMVRTLKPRYNILLRDDKSFPYIFVQSEHPFPQIRKYRGAQTEKGKYFGPFASAGAVNETLAFLERAFLLRSCPDTVFRNRTRPCLQYQIKRCSAPCVRKVNEEQYAGLVAQATHFLAGKSREIQDELLRQMQAASDATDYETAAGLRDRVRALTQVQHEQRIHAVGLGDADVIALKRESGLACVELFCFRQGQNFGNRSYFPSHTEGTSDEELLAGFIGQFYQRHEIPREILVSHLPAETSVLEEALCLKAGHKVTVHLPERGDKRGLVSHALHSASLSLDRHARERMSEQTLREGVSRLFGLEAAPVRIEVYDNSHISGTLGVGAMIVAGPDGFDKKSYRHFNIRSLTAGADDYAMMREVLTRRFTRLQKEDPGRTGGTWPDLVLIDGGAGHLTQVSGVLADLGIYGLCFACIAKGPERNAGRETFFLPGREPFQLPPNDPVLHYLQRLRDEAHRFAIGAHRGRRSRAIRITGLEEIEGIGEKRKKALLHHFGSRFAVERASLADLRGVPGINQKTAQMIYDYFHS